MRIKVPVRAFCCLEEYRFRKFWCASASFWCACPRLPVERRASLGMAFCCWSSLSILPGLFGAELANLILNSRQFSSFFFFPSLRHLFCKHYDTHSLISIVHIMVALLIFLLLSVAFWRVFKYLYYPFCHIILVLHIYLLLWLLWLTFVSFLSYLLPRSPLIILADHSSGNWSQLEVNVTDGIPEPYFASSLHVSGFQLYICCVLVVNILFWYKKVSWILSSAFFLR